MERNGSNRTCPSCGNKILADDMFCMYCGEKIEVPQPAPIMHQQHVCSGCGMLLQEDDTFCMYCGTKVEVPLAHEEEPLQQVCRKCGSPILDDDVFCMNCGAKLGNGELVAAIVVGEAEEQTDEPEPEQQAAVGDLVEDEAAEDVEDAEEIERLNQEANEEANDELEQEQEPEDIQDEPYAAPVIVVEETQEEDTEIPEEPAAAVEIEETEPSEEVVQATKSKRKKRRKMLIAVAALVVVVLLGFGGYAVWQSGQDTATVPHEEPVPIPTVTEDEPEELLTPEPISSAEPNVEVSPEPSKEPDPVPSPEQSEATGEQVGTDAKEKTTSTPEPTPSVEPTPEVTPTPTSIPTPKPSTTPALVAGEIELPITSDQNNETGTTFERVTALVTDDKVIHFKVYYTVGETFNVELSNTPPSTGKLAYTDLGSVEPGSGTLSFDLTLDTMAPGGFAVYFRNEEHYTWVGVGPEGTNVIYQSSGYSAPAPETTPTPTPEVFPIGTAVSLDFWVKADYGEGATFSGVYAEKTTNSMVIFTIQFAVNQNFNISISSYPAGINESGKIAPDDTAYSFSVSEDVLSQASSITISLYDDSGKNALEGGNTYWVGINQDVIDQICNR